MILLLFVIVPAIVILLLFFIQLLPGKTMRFVACTILMFAATKLAYNVRSEVELANQRQMQRTWLSIVDYTKDGIRNHKSNGIEKLFGAFIDDVTTDSSVDKTDGSFLQKTSMLSINLYKLPPDKDSKTTK